MKISRHAFIKAIAAIAGLTGIGAIKGLGKKPSRAILDDKIMRDLREAAEIMDANPVPTSGRAIMPTNYLGDEFKVGDTFSLSWKPGRIYTVTDVNSVNEIKVHLTQ